MSGKNTGNSGGDSGLPTSSLSSCGVEHSVDTTQEDPQSQADAENPDQSCQLPPDVTNSGSPSPANREQSDLTGADDNELDFYLTNPEPSGVENSSVASGEPHPLIEALPLQCVLIGPAVATADASVPTHLPDCAAAPGDAAASAPSSRSILHQIPQQYDERAKTFPAMGVLEKKLCFAGLYHHDNRYKCCVCSFSIKSSDLDTLGEILKLGAWEYHAQHSPDCKYLIAVRGTEFIKDSKDHPKGAAAETPTGGEDQQQINDLCRETAITLEKHKVETSESISSIQDKLEETNISIEEQGGEVDELHAALHGVQIRQGELETYTEESNTQMTTRTDELLGRVDGLSGRQEASEQDGRRTKERVTDLERAQPRVIPRIMRNDPAGTNNGNLPSYQEAMNAPPFAAQPPATRPPTTQPPAAQPRNTHDS